MTDPVIRELLRDIQELTSRQFVYDTRWGGFVPAGGALSERQTGPPAPFADLHWQDKADVLRNFISWDHYRQHGLDWRDHATIEYNVACCKPPDRWLEGTSFHEPSQRLGEAKSEPPPLAERFQEILNQPAAGTPQHLAKGYAPDLLEMLQAAEQHCTEGLDCAESDHMEAALQDVLVNVRAAIAKVTAERQAQEPEKGKDMGIER
jgi:hypothetical protein